jgi:hypothetical protein
MVWAFQRSLLVITAIMMALPTGKEIKRSHDLFQSGWPIPAPNNQIGSEQDRFPSVIASRSQLEEITPEYR